MPRIAVPPLSQTAATDPAAFFAQLRVLVDSFETQVNANAYVSSRGDNKLEQGLKRLDPIFRLFEGRIQVGVFDGKKARWLNNTDLQALQNPNPNTQFKGMHADPATVTSATALAYFPDINDWGFYNRTATSVIYLVYNYTGLALKSIGLI